jgi:hypothetical protein
LLILDGHESHQLQDFKDYCLENKILTLCMPAHLSHILQLLDIICFAPLKLKYSQRVRDLACRRVFHINKEGFLPAFRDAFFDMFTAENCKKAFKAAGLVPLNPAEVLDRLKVQLRTPLQPLTPDMLWHSKTPSNVLEFGSQSKLVRETITRSPTAARTGLAQLIKGTEMMMHGSALMESRITELEEQLATITKQKSRKRKRIQTGGTLEYGAAADQVAASTSLPANIRRKTRSSGAAEEIQSTQRRCSTCGGIGHNARTCQVDRAEDSESAASTAYAGSLFNSD